MSSLLDIVVGQLALRRELVSSDQLQDCVVEQLHPPHPPLGQVLVKRRLVSPGDLLAIMQAAERTRLTCSRCRRGFAYGQLNPTAEPLCPGCGGVLGLDGVSQQRPGMHQTLALTRPDTRGSQSYRRPPTRLDSAGSKSYRPGSQEFSGTFGRYQIGEELGRGGMGVVYKATAPGLPMPVALKILLGGEMASRNQVARFKREAEIASRLDHPNIVQIHDVGVEGDYYFFTMDLVEGVPLSKLIKKRQLGVRRAVEIARDVARGLAHAHGSEVIHRDIKPDNIIIDLDGNPVITDFGLAREVDPEMAARLTRSGALVGTPFYMSPEQASGKRQEVRAPADLYALGVVLFEMLTLQLPFMADTQLELTSKIVNDDPPSLSSLEPDIDRDLETVVLKALAKSPTDRYATADDLADDLDRWLDGEPVVARRPSLIERLSRRVKRNPRVAGLLAGGTLIVLASVAAVAGAASSLDTNGDVADGTADGTVEPPPVEPPADEEERKLAAEALAKAEEAFTHAERVPAGEEYRQALDAAVRRVTQALTHPLNQQDTSLYLRRGRTQERLRRDDLASSDYDRARELEPQGAAGAEASYLLARMAMRADDEERAIEVLRAQREIDELQESSDPSPWRSLVEAMLRHLEGDDEGALALASVVRAEYPEISEAYGIEAGMLVSLGRIQDALRILEQAVTVDPQEALVWSNLAQIRLNTNPTRGKEDLRRALELDPENKTALRMRAMVHHAEGNLEDAIVDLRRVLNRYPEDVEVLLNLASYYAEAKQAALSEQTLKKVERAAPNDPRPYEFRSRAYLDALDLDRAVSELRNGIRAVYNDLEARKKLAERFETLCIETRQVAAAEEWIQFQLDKKPGDPDALTLRILVLHSSGRKSEAEDLAHELRRKYPDHLRSWQIYIRLGAVSFGWTPDQLETELVQYANAVAKDAEGLAWLAKFHLVAPQGKVEQAKRFAKSALEIDPDNVGAHMSLGLAASRENDLRQAKEHLVAALRRDPTDIEALSILGAVEYNQGKPQASIGYLKEALKGDPMRLTALEGMGHALVRTRRYKECVEFVDRYVGICREAKIKPEAPILVPYIRAKLRLDQADPLFEFLAKLAEDYEEPNYNVLLAQALANAGRIVQCRKVLDKVLEEHPDHEAAKGLLEELKRKIAENGPR